MFLIPILLCAFADPAWTQVGAEDEDRVAEGEPPRRGVLERVERDSPPVDPVPNRSQPRDEIDANIKDQPEPGSLDMSDPIERGRYLTHSVAMCVICHSPKNPDGTPMSGQHFQGGRIPAQPTSPRMTPWAEFAPALGPLVRGNEEDVVALLTTGVRPRTGTPPRPPMPPFRFTEEDAKAIVEFLKSLPL